MKMRLFPVILAILSSGFAEAAGFDGQNRESVEQYLRSLAPVGDEEVKKMIEGIGSDDFAVRQQSLSDLARVAASKRRFLENERRTTGNPEVRKGIARVLSRVEADGDAAGEQGRELEFAAQAISKHGHEGLGAELLAAMGAASGGRGRELAVAAARLSADEGDRAELVVMLGSKHAEARAAALHVLSALGDARAQARPLLADEAAAVRLAAAAVFAAVPDAACMPVLGELAGGKDFYIRWRAAEMLRQLSGGEISVDLLSSAAAVDLGKWTDAVELGKISVPQAIGLMGDGDDWEKFWKVKPQSIYDVQKVERLDGLVRLAATGWGVHASRLSFQNYRLRLGWRFPVRQNLKEGGGSPGNSGVSIGKFVGPIPERHQKWNTPEVFEVEILLGDTGSIYHHGGQMFARGQLAKEKHVKKWHPHNEDAGGWNELEIVERDGLLRIYVNGLLQNEVSGIGSLPTCLGLRNEGHQVDFRNVSLEPLPGAKIVVSGQAQAEEGEAE